MAPKRKSSAGDASISERQKKVMSLNQKVELLDRLSRGESVASVGRHYCINQSTIRYIWKNKKAICESVSASAVSSMKGVTHVWDVHIERMEKALSIWIKDIVQKSMPLSRPLIRKKTKRIYEYMSGVGGASTRDAPNNDGERASADHEAAKAFPAQIARLIEEKGYRPEQAFNADNTGLFWKKMPTRTFISKHEETASEFKAAKDPVSLLLCANAKGDLMMKSMMLYRSLNPRALKGKNKQTLPMFGRANRKAWVMAAIFLDRFYNCFVPQVERYMVGKNLAFKVLLLLDNALSHPANLEEAHPNVEAIRNFTGFPDNTEERHVIVGLARQVGGEGFDDMMPEELEDLIASHGDNLTDEELETIITVSKEEETGSDEEEVPRSNLTVQFLGELLHGMRALVAKLEDADPVMEMYLKAKRGLDDLFLPYKELHQNLRQFSWQLSITRFFHPAPSTSTLPAPSSPATLSVPSPAPSTTASPLPLPQYTTLEDYHLGHPESSRNSWDFNSSPSSSSSFESCVCL
uniref:tigger transposable element-derived protein 1-like n=1 Tax=Myxine glutinosa TaxID=7769 RepID=UPI00358F4578